MEYKYEEGDIVLYKKDNSFYKVLEVMKSNNAETAIALDYYKIGNKIRVVHLVWARDIELP